MVDFDHDRLDGATQYLRGNPVSTIKFQYLIMDYMTHLSELESDLTPEQHAREETSVSKFISLINTQDAWPIAKQYAPQLANVSAPDIRVNDSYLSRIQLAVSHRLQHPATPDRKDRLRQWEAQLLWERTLGQLKFLASLLGPMTPERKREFTSAVDLLAAIAPFETPDGDDDEKVEELNIGRRGLMSTKKKNPVQPQERSKQEQKNNSGRDSAAAAGATGHKGLDHAGGHTILRKVQPDSPSQQATATKSKKDKQSFRSRGPQPLPENSRAKKGGQAPGMKQQTLTFKTVTKKNVVIDLEEDGQCHNGDTGRDVKNTDHACEMDDTEVIDDDDDDDDDNDKEQGLWIGSDRMALG